MQQYEKSVDKIKFEKYLKMLRAHLGDRKVYLVLDNLSVHTCAWSKHMMATLDYTWAFNAPYFPDGNPIEMIFAAAKHNFKKQKLQALAKGCSYSTSECIEKAFEKVTKEQVTKCVKHSN